MEKISRILPTSHRFQTVEKSHAQIARPGASQLGRASIQEAQAEKVSVSQLARDILKQAQAEKDQRLPQLDLDQDSLKTDVKEPLVPIKSHEVQEILVETQI